MQSTEKEERHAVRTTIGAAAAIILTAVSGCGTGNAEDLSTALQAVEAQTRDITASVAATGTIEPIRIIDVKSQASGEILHVAVELGDQVARGDLLVEIDPRDVRNAYEQAVADLEVAQARLTVAERQLGRTRALRDSAVVTEDELESAILEHANARAALVKAETNLELNQDKLQDVTVRAPIAGTIVEDNVEEGQIVTSTREVTGGTVLMRMADLEEVQVRTLVDETDIGSLREGLPATIRVEAYPEREFHGQVLKIEPQAVVEQGVTLFAVLTRIRNEEGLLRPGMNADVEIVFGSREDVLALPNGAVKTVEEARQLAVALELDPALLEARVEAPEAESADSAGAGGEPIADGLPSMTELQRMPRDERRALIEDLEPAQRQRLFRAFRELQEQRATADRADPARPKPAFVFVAAAEGGLTLKPVTIGLSSWEYTEIVAGLDAGQQVVQVPLSLVQQRELLERIRSRSSVPGMSRS